MGAWYLAQTGGHLKLDAVEVLPQLGSAVVTVASVEHDILLEPAAVHASPYLVLRIENGGVESHEVLIARLAASTDPATLGEVEALANYAGGVYLFPSFGEELVLADLPPGDYALLCFLETPDGTAHAALGEAARLTVKPADMVTPAP